LARSETFGAYKLPHQDVEDGKLVTVLNGVLAAGADMEGIPDKDMPAVRKHLARHYAQFEKVPPWKGDNLTTPTNQEKGQFGQEQNSMSETDPKPDPAPPAAAGGDGTPAAPPAPASDAALQAEQAKSAALQTQLEKLQEAEKATTIAALCKLVPGATPEQYQPMALNELQDRLALVNDAVAAVNAKFIKGAAGTPEGNTNPGGGVVIIPGDKPGSNAITTEDGYTVGKFNAKGQCTQGLGVGGAE